VEVGAVDIGGSGCRAARVRLRPDGNHEVGRVEALGPVHSRRELANAVRGALGPIDRLGISTAGYVDTRNGVVRLCRVQPWAEGCLRDRVEHELDCRAAVVNDGEAHVLAHASLGRHPMLCFSFGTSVGFGCTGDDGEVLRPRADSNWDIGAVRLATRASKREVWWALGSHGLEELQQSMGGREGATHFGWRVGSLVRDFAVIFQPRTVALCGGIIDVHGSAILDSVRREVQAHWSRDLPAPPLFLTSPFGPHSGLVGAAVAAKKLI
jgi:predicted NBD/HSP70 family sugar kinase